MNVEIPDQLKADMPPTRWGKILAATPVVMAVVATMLAGLSSSEMTRAQYARSMAAQQQSKAGDQWSFFQAKRLRGALQRNTVDLMQSLAPVRPFDPAVLEQFAQQLPVQAGRASPDDKSGGKDLKAELTTMLRTPAAQQLFPYLQKGELPRPDPGMGTDPNIKAALAGLENLASDTEMAPLLAAVTDKDLEEAVRSARDQAQSLDELTRPLNQSLDQLDGLLTRAGTAMGQNASPVLQQVSASAPAAVRDFTVARLRYAALRYELEGRLNQAIANLYELQVRKSNIAAVRFHTRSQRFFYGMLGAQLGVIVSTFAMAARKRNLLWSLAAAAGLIAVAFAVYVYLWV